MSDISIPKWGYQREICRGSQFWQIIPDDRDEGYEEAGHDDEPVGRVHGVPIPHSLGVVGAVEKIGDAHPPVIAHNYEYRPINRICFFFTFRQRRQLCNILEVK